MLDTVYLGFRKAYRTAEAYGFGGGLCILIQSLLSW